MLRTLSLALALATSLALPNIATAHDYGGWRGPGWRHAWGYGGGACWRWIDGEQVWVC